MCTGLVVVSGGGVESRQAKCAAGEINESDDPAGAGKFLQHDAVNHQRRSETKRNDVGEGIELAAKRAFIPAQPRETTIQEIENESTEHEPDGGMKKIAGCVRIRRLQERAFENLESGSETAKQIARRHEIGQEINFGMMFVHGPESCAMIVDPAAT